MCFLRAPAMSRATALYAIKCFHTLVWIFFVGCILSIPLFALRGEFGSAFGVAAIVLIEAVVLVFNKWRCPLTAVAARYTDDRRDNFDIYLPLWLARYNKVIFGWLFAAVLVSTLLLWYWR
jgi:polyferredoxin